MFSGTARSALLLLKVFVELSHSTGFDKCNCYNEAQIENYNGSA